VNNFNKLKRIFTIFGTHYPDDTSYQRRVKFPFKIFLSLCSFGVIMTSPKMTFSRDGDIQLSLCNTKNKTNVEKLAIGDFVD